MQSDTSYHMYLFSKSVRAAHTDRARVACECSRSHGGSLAHIGSTQPLAGNVVVDRSPMADTESQAPSAAEHEKIKDEQPATEEVEAPAEAPTEEDASEAK